MPREGHDYTGGRKEGIFLISIHVPREGHDLQRLGAQKCVRRFQSTCPARGTTTFAATIEESYAFQSTCPARGTTRRRGNRPRAGRRILIHVPREGHDPSFGVRPVTGREISIHVPREGHDLRYHVGGRGHGQFQSTCPARGTTTTSTPRRASWSHFNPRAPRGARRHGTDGRGRDDVFQSTCPARGTT